MLAPAHESVPVGEAPAAAVVGGLEFGARVAYSIPLGNVTGDPGASLSNIVSNRIPLELELGYRVNPALMIGAYFTYAVVSINTGQAYGGACSGGGVSCSANDVEVGAQLHYHLLPDRKFDPWLGIGAGYEIISFNATVGSTTELAGNDNGFTFLNLQVGGDIKATPAFAIAPVLSFSLGQYGSCSLSGAAVGGSGNCTIPQQSMHEWFTFGVRGAYDLAL
jgi:outer membrane protein W